MALAFLTAGPTAEKVGAAFSAGLQRACVGSAAAIARAATRRHNPTRSSQAQPP